MTPFRGMVGGKTHAHSTLHFHPLSSFWMKALVGLYELDVPFTKRLVDLANEADRAAFLKVWPLGKFPVLRDEARGITRRAESSVILRGHRQPLPGATGDG